MQAIDLLNFKAESPANWYSRRFITDVSDTRF